MKYLFPATILVIFMIWSACGPDGPDTPVVTLQTGDDSLAYAIGVLNGQNIKSDLFSSVDGEEFKQGIRDGLDDGNLKYSEEEINTIIQDFLSERRQSGVSYSDEKINRLSYAFGVSMSANLEQMGITQVDKDIMVAGMNDIMSDGQKAMSFEDAQVFFNTQMMVVSERRLAENREKGRAFLEENAARPEVTTTTSGLQYEIVEVGTGPKPDANSKVRVHYHGTLIDGTVFDSSVKRGQPAEFPVGGVIQGWVEALQLMPEGSKWILYIPADLAYGERGSGPVIGPGATLIFEVELLEIL